MAIVVLLAVIGYPFGRLAGGLLSKHIERRAAVLISEEFRDGLRAWRGAEGWSRTWSYSPGGYAEVGRLAVLAPTRLLSDYQCEFLCGITGRSIGWAYRVQDLENYYATELAIIKPGPLPAVSLIRYTVTGGRKMDEVRIPLRIAVRTDRPVLIRLMAKGDGFTTWIADKIVDFWQDDRFRNGGVGFFAEGSDRPQLYWVKVSHNNDAMGKLCAMLAPGRREVSEQ